MMSDGPAGNIALGLLLLLLVKFVLVPGAAIGCIVAIMAMFRGNRMAGLTNNEVPLSAFFKWVGISIVYSLCFTGIAAYFCELFDEKLGLITFFSVLFVILLRLYPRPV